MNKEEITKRFNKLLFDFFKDVIVTYPDIKIFNELRVQLRMALMADEKIAINQFHEQLVNNYKNEILKENEDFFLKFDLSGTVLSSLNELKNLWTKSSDENKKKLWKYIKVLTVLSEKVHS